MRINARLVLCFLSLTRSTLVRLSHLGCSSSVSHRTRYSPLHSCQELAPQNDYGSTSSSLPLFASLVLPTPSALSDAVEVANYWSQKHTHG